MNVTVAIGVLEGCAFEDLNNAELFHQVLDEAVLAGNFTELHRHVHQFSPQGLTAAVVLAESHIALHSWPENGTLFVDIASCSGGDSAQQAFERLRSLIPHSHVRKNQHEYRAGSPVPAVAER